MNEARPYASLSSGLLARKGSAKPAMRPQGYTGFEDLGWNDMGYAPAAQEVHEPAAAPEHVPSSIAALTPAPRSKTGPGESLESEEPSVVAQQRAILESFEGEAEAEAEPPEAPVVAARLTEAAAKVVPLPRRGRAAAGRKAAFTLRLDSDRHLRLRLACAVTGRSAQQFVTAALDAQLASMPELDGLAERVPASSPTASTLRTGNSSGKGN